MRSNSSEGLPRVVGRKCLPQHHFVVIALAHAFAHRFHFGHVFFRRVIARRFQCSARLVGFVTGSPSRLKSLVESSPRVEIILEPFDLFLLAIHVVYVVAQKQMQILGALARQLQLIGSNCSNRS